MHSYFVNASSSRQRGMVIARLNVLLSSEPPVVSWKKMLHDKYLCLVEFDKIQPENSETKATLKRVRIRSVHSASVAFS